MRTTVPPPGRFSIVISPPIAAINVRAIGSPRPRPGTSVVALSPSEELEHRLLHVVGDAGSSIEHLDHAVVGDDHHRLVAVLGGVVDKEPQRVARELGVDREHEVSGRLDADG